MPAGILIIEDDEVQAQLMADFLKRRGYRVWTARTGEEGLRVFQRYRPDAVLLDQRLPGLQGIGVLQELRRRWPHVPVIMITAFGEVAQAVEAIKAGAFHYLTKPVDLQEVDLLLQRALEHGTLVRENQALQAALRQTLPKTPLVYTSAAMQEVMSLVSRVAATDATVLITGETGTGKELVARVIHHLSPRREAPFVAVNVAALPDTLVEAELFGYEKGAFTGADRRRIGRLEAAHRGTLFLDEVGELPPPVQVKLLRFLQERTIERLGSNESLELDVRVVAATNRDLEALVREGKFREDLFYRLNVVRIHLPPLRERRQDILPLARHFLREYARKHGKPVEDFTREAVDALLAYEFPGNVRELQNLVERAVILARGPWILRQDLGLPQAPSTSIDLSAGSTLDEQLANVERRLILEALEQAGGVQAKAARLLGLSERALRYRMERLGLKTPRGRSSKT